MYEFALVPGEFATWCRRALNERPYIRAVTIRFKFQFVVLLKTGSHSFNPPFRK